MVSWLSSIHGYASLPWFIVPIISGRVGRKYPFLAVNIITLISYIMVYFSSTAKQIFIAEIFQGPTYASSLTISIIIVTEYSSPKHRGLFLTLKSASMNWGIWVANALGTFFHWKTVAVTGIICSIYNVIVPLFWCESPVWLASKYRYEECARMHRWLKGVDEESEKELASLIRSCKEYQDNRDAYEMRQMNFVKRSYRTVLDKAFYKPILICIGLLTLYHASGKLICSVYAIDVIKKITSSESTAYKGMLILDAVTVMSMYIGSSLSRYIRRRIMLLTGASGGVIFLFVLAMYLFLCKSNVINENNYLSLALLMLFFLFVSMGPMILSTSIHGELMPLRYRTAGMFITGIWISIVFSTTLKTAPFLFRTFELHGAFLFYVASASILIFLLYHFLPETKDRSLQEIEECIIGTSRRDDSIELQSVYKK